MEEGVRLEMTKLVQRREMNKTRTFYSRHFQWLEEQNVLIYTIIMAVYSLLGRIVLLLILSPALFLFPRETLVTQQPDVPWEIALLLAPVLETIIFQWAPIWLTERLHQKAPIQIGVSTALFSLMHYSSGILGILAAASSGLVFAYIFVRRKKKSTWQAMATVALTHFWVNCFAYVAISVKSAYTM